MSVEHAQIDPFQHQRELMDARMGSVWTAIDGIRNVLDRLTDTVQEQAKQNTQVALIANTVSSFQESFVDHRAHTEDALEAHAKRISALEKINAVKETDKKGLWTVVGLGVTGLAAFATANFDKIAGLF